MSSIRTLEETTKFILEEDKQEHYFGLRLASYHSQGLSVVIKNRPSSCERFAQRSIRAISNHSNLDVIENFAFLVHSYSLAYSRPLIRDMSYPPLPKSNSDGTPLCLSLRRLVFFQWIPNRGHICLAPQLFTTFLNSWAKSHCSDVGVTVHPRHLDGRKEEL